MHAAKTLSNPASAPINMRVTRWILMAISLIKSIQCHIEPFIVGGSFAAIKRYPHSAFMSVACQRKTGKSVNWICGASVLNERLLLTAGHCLSTCVQESEINVSVGNEHKGKGINSAAHSFIIHDGYNPRTSAGDIGLVRLFVSLKFSALVRRVAVMRDPPYNEQAFVAGWGLIDEEKLKTSPYLKHIDQKVWPNRNCVGLLKSLPSGSICASAQKPTDYAASGDSGSALIVRGYIQIGLVSYKIPGWSNNVIVYTDVGYYYEWITFNAKRLYCL